MFSDGSRDNDLLAEGLIGTDEAGKGDYFGPLVCAACYVDSRNAKRVEAVGTKDSKKISNKKAHQIASSIKRICPHDVVVIGPKRYNELYQEFRNLNKLLAWAHARALENLLGKVDCRRAMTDQFGDVRFVQNALQEKGRQIELIQVPRAESNLAVAAASVLARAEFLRRLDLLSESFGVNLHPGAGPPTDAALLEFVEKHGREKLPLVAKVHFKNTKKALS